MENKNSNERSAENEMSIALEGNNLFFKYGNYLGRSVSNFQDLYGLKHKFHDGHQITSNPYLLGMNDSSVKIISYNDSNGSDQRSISNSMGARRIAVSVKHHAPCPDEDPKEVVKFQATHAQLVIKSGDRVFSVNNPQSYQNGLFGDPSYPMIFFVPKYPELTSQQQIRNIEENIVVWSLILNTYSHFPGDYNGGDPLSARSKDEVHYFGNKILSAMMGNENSLDWLKDKQNQLYCAELVFMSLTLGLTFPLTREFLGEEMFTNLESKIESLDFLNDNSNPYIKDVHVKLPDNDLVPLESDDIGDYFGNDLAVRPMLVSDMLTSFIKYSINRKKLGESCGKYQFELFKITQKFLNHYLPPEAFEPESEIMKLIKEVENVLISNHIDYSNFQLALKPLLKRVDGAVSNYSTSSNTFIPPHTFLIRALELSLEGKQKGLIGMEYLGHGVHEDLI